MTMLCQVSFPIAWCIHLPPVLPFFGNHGVTHPTQQRRFPGSSDLRKEQKASTTPEFAAQALDGVGLD